MNRVEYSRKKIDAIWVWFEYVSSRRAKNMIDLEHEEGWVSSIRDKKQTMFFLFWFEYLNESFFSFGNTTNEELWWKYLCEHFVVLCKFLIWLKMYFHLYFTQKTIKQIHMSSYRSNIDKIVRFIFILKKYLFYCLWFIRSSKIRGHLFQFSCKYLGYEWSEK